MNPTRRTFALGISTAAFALSAPLVLQSDVAKAGLTGTTLLDLALSSHPFLAIVGLIESGAEYILGFPDQEAERRAREEQQTQLNNISSGVAEILSKQNQIIALFASQQIMIRDELALSRFNETVSDLMAESYAFSVALAYDDPKIQSSALLPCINNLSRITAKLGGRNFGVSALPAYLAAIAVQNSAHYMSNSPTPVFIAVNKPHQANLNELLNGSGPTSLVSIIKNERGDIEALDTLGKQFTLAEIVKWRTSNNRAHCTIDIIYAEYMGVSGSEPIVTKRYLLNSSDYDVDVAPPRYLFPNSTDALAVGNGTFIYPKANAFVSDDYRKIPELFGTVGDVYGITEFDASGLAVLPRNASAAIDEQVAAIVNYYKSLMSNQNNSKDTSQIYSDVHKLLQAGLDGVGRIIKVKTAESVRPPLQERHL